PSPEIIPGLSTRFPNTSKTVDSIPTWHCPPSIANCTRPSRLPTTCPTFVGEISFDRFALGPAKGNPHRRITACINGCDGQRTATVSPPAVTSSGIPAAFGKTNVNAPGQYFRANPPARSGQSETQL